MTLDDRLRAASETTRGSFAADEVPDLGRQAVGRRTGRAVAVFMLVAVIGVTVAVAVGGGDRSQVTADGGDRSTITGQPRETRSVTCGGGPGFPVAALDGPTGAEEADTPEAEGLRAVIETFGGTGAMALPRTGWLLLDSHDTSVTFGVQGDKDEGLTVVSLRPDGNQWVFHSSAFGCRDLMVVPPEGLSTAVWWPDPDVARSPDDRVLHVLATDPDCASGRPTGDRLRAPVIEINEDEVVITFTAEPLSEDHDCPGHPPTTYEVQLEEPIGQRTLLDGAYWPPRPPQPRP